MTQIIIVAVIWFINVFFFGVLFGLYLYRYLDSKKGGGDAS